MIFKLTKSVLFSVKKSDYFCAIKKKGKFYGG